MIRFKSCPRCRGDLVLDKDQYGWYEECIQCGYLHDVETIVEVKKRLAEEDVEKELARAA